jgi:pentose-5-phosphate-3-epimerase
LRLGADATMVDSFGRTALHVGTLVITNLWNERILYSAKCIVKMLIEAGCDVTHCDVNGSTFVDVAKQLGGPFIPEIRKLIQETITSKKMVAS